MFSQQQPKQKRDRNQAFPVRQTKTRGQLYLLLRVGEVM